MNNLTSISDALVEIEILSWLEEQAARVAFDNEAWLQEQDEEFTESFTSRFS
tara:strand:- start:725 stop:880 length:156 start_codon:yes stop_codon:yes gene_type:complete